ncbi:MAG: ZIP family metal transporter [Planctomycetes bacterium]|nr:ZIP family metal transporter [Planctomycetota bacterium]
MDLRTFATLLLALALSGCGSTSAAADDGGAALAATYCFLIVLASLGGGFVPSMVRLTHNRLQVVVSLVGGLMLGIGLFHMLPHAVHQTGSIDRSAWWMMMGLLTMFFLLRTFHFHQHAAVDLPLAAGEVLVAQFSPHVHADHPQHGHAHDHDHAAVSHPAMNEAAHACAGVVAHADCEHTHRLSWLGVAFGLGLHTFIDGVALAAGVAAASSAVDAGRLAGLGTFLAILFHKPLDAVSITTLMAAAGWSGRARAIVNVAFALMCPLGAAAFFVGLAAVSGGEAVVVGCALAYSAGVFLCIALGDLLPEIEFHSHNRLPLSLALVSGILLAWAIGFLEPPHLHQPPVPARDAGAVQ